MQFDRLYIPVYYFLLLVINHIGPTPESITLDNQMLTPGGVYDVYLMITTIFDKVEIAMTELFLINSKYKVVFKQSRPLQLCIILYKNCTYFIVPQIHFLGPPMIAPLTIHHVSYHQGTLMARYSTTIKRQTIYKV